MECHLIPRSARSPDARVLDPRSETSNRWQDVFVGDWVSVAAVRQSRVFRRHSLTGHVTPVYFEMQDLPKAAEIQLAA